MPRTRRRRGSKGTRRQSRRLKGGQQPFLEVRFPDGTKASPAPGPLMKKEAASPQPSVSWRAPAKIYTLICIDPDAPATPWLHWLVTNCKGASPSTGTTVTPWAPPTPPPGTGTHRYQFKLLEQVRAIQIPPPASRASFPFQAFLKSNALKEVASTEIRVTA